MPKPKDKKIETPSDLLAKAISLVMEEQKAKAAPKPAKFDLFPVFFVITILGMFAIAYFRK